MTSAGVYVRISSDPEGLALGVERQEEDARKLADRRGWAVVETYVDNDITASGKRKRPGWERLLTDIAEGRIDAVVAYSSSRMYRNVRDLDRLIALVNTTGADIATVVSGDIVLDTADGRMMAGILARIDQGEWERTSERRQRQNRQKREQAAAEGKVYRYAGRRRAFGYSADGHSLDEAEAAFLKDAARRIIAGMSAYRITMEWKDAGVVTPYGARWTPNHLTRTLRGRHLLGTSDSPAILTVDEHELLTAVLALDPRTGKARTASVGRPAGRRYAALGLLTCGLCGAKLTGRSGQYICQACGRIGAKASPLEQWLVEHVFVNAPAGRPPKPEPTADVRPLLAAIRSLDARYAEVEQAVGDGDMPAKAGGTILAKLEDERLELQRQLGRDLPGATNEGPALEWPPEPEYVTRWIERKLTDAETATLQDFLRTFVGEVTVGPKVTGNGRGFNPARLTVVWH